MIKIIPSDKKEICKVAIKMFNLFMEKLNKEATP